MVVSLGTTLGVVAIEGLFGLLILTILWPTRRSATRLLRRWGVADPTAAEQAQALTYLRRRRFWYPWLFLGLPAVLNGTGVLRDDQDGVWLFPAMLLIGALLAEMFAQRRSPVPVRAAVLVHRRLTDIVPGWALVLYTVAALAAVLLLGGALAGVGWVQHWYSDWSARTVWTAMAGAVLTVVVVWLVVGLAMRRPAVPELRIDPLLRSRSARVSVGLGTGTLFALVASGQNDFRGMIILVVGLFFWSLIAGPVRQPVPA